MKKISIIVITALSLFYSCKKDKEQFNDKCWLTVHVGLEIAVSELQPQLKSTITTDDFEVLIYNTTGNVVKSFARAVDMPDKIELEPGDYYVVAHSNNWSSAAFENPYYYGETTTFLLDKEEEKNISVNCSLANCAVTIVYSDNIINEFSDYSTTVTSENGSLTFLKGETRKGYFELSSLDVEATLTFDMLDGSTKQKFLAGTIDNPEAKKLYEIRLDASLKSSSGMITINLDESFETEIVNISSEGDTVVPDGINYGDLLITEIMYDPSAMSDTKGEWFEIFNNTNDEISLDSLVIKKGTSTHLIETDKILVAGEYYVLARSDTAVNVDFYQYSGISLNNTGADIGIYTYGTDGTNGIEIASVAYDDGGDFPAATGASLNLHPSILDADEAKLGSNWCLATNLYNSSDLGTPGVVNSACW